MKLTACWQAMRLQKIERCQPGIVQTATHSDAARIMRFQLGDGVNNL